ncbi:hypothetical protein UCRPC4_g02900 [Phaeomoniella chlamydospora]|uniref:Uncharacterized protein n=1 Tax=Phaeomoniella chlamydospora TaxID=158046 RepID=A0A0G2EL00_PHACM|nr:hypothetical protein UCRPC4_g02900 [Phaeomoniella chlamydospora]
MEMQTTSEVLYRPPASDLFWSHATRDAPRFELVAVKRDMNPITDINKRSQLCSKGSPPSSSPADSSASGWSHRLSQEDSRYSPGTSYASSTFGSELVAFKQAVHIDYALRPQNGGRASSALTTISKAGLQQDDNASDKDSISALKHPRSFHQYTLFFLDGYSPFGGCPAPSAETKHQVSMLSSMDIFLKERLSSHSVYGPIAVDTKAEGMSTAFEEPFNRFWAVLYLLEAEKMDEGFTALDEWCDYIKGMLRTQQPPLLSLMSMMYDEFRQMGKPEIADRVLNYLTNLAEVYFGKHHPMSVMLWCLRASNIADEKALPELALERAVQQLGSIQHEHIILLLEDFKLRWTHILRQRNKTEEAIVVLKRMCVDQENVYGATSPKAIEPLYVIARTYFAAEKDLPAVVGFQEVLQRTGELQTEHHIWLRACAHGRLAQVYKRLGYDLQARSHALSLLSEAGKIWDNDHPQRKVWLSRIEKENIL